MCADGNTGDVTEIDPPADELVGHWLSLSEVAERLGTPLSRIKQLLRDHRLLALRRPDGSLVVPAAFFEGNHIVKGLHGTLTLLFDSGFQEVEAVRWLFTSDDTLLGTPIQAMCEHRSTEVNRRAQALAF